MHKSRCRGTRAPWALALAITVSCAGEIERDRWATWDEGGFLLQLPSQFIKVPVQGEDSQVGRFVTPDGTVGVDYDFGWWSSDLESEKDSFADFASHREVIGGEEAVVVIGTLRPDVRWSHRGQHVVAATWQGLGGEGSIMKLTIFVQMVDAAIEAQMMTVLRGVTFRRPIERR